MPTTFALTSGLQFVLGSSTGGDAPTQTYLEVNTGSGFCVECWVGSINLLGDDKYHIFAHKGTNSSTGWRLAHYDGITSTNLFFFIGGTSAAGSAALGGNTGSHHVAGTYDGTTLRVYFDGTEVDNTLGAGLTTSTSAKMAVGSILYVDGGITYGNYIMDELRVSQSVRYTSNFAPGSVEFVNDGSTAGLYHMNNGSMTDASSNANNGTTNAYWVPGWVYSGDNGATSIALMPTMQMGKYWGPI